MASSGNSGDCRHKGLVLSVGCLMLLLSTELLLASDLSHVKAETGPNSQVSTHHFCTGQLPPLIELPPVSVGCSLLDCCPGCPALDAPMHLGAVLEVSVKGTLAEHTSLKFLNIDPDQVMSLSLENAGYHDESTINLGVGTVRIKVPPDMRTSLLVAPQLQTAEPENRYWNEAFADISLHVLSSEGKLLAALDYFVSAVGCPGGEPPPTPADCSELIDLEENDSGDAAVVLLDGRSEFGCLNDKLLRGADKLSIGNVLTPGNCRNEIIVLSRDDGVKVLDHDQSSNWSIWKDTLGDVQKVILDQDVITLPLKLVVAMSNGTGQIRRDNAEEYLVTAENYLNDHFSGIDVKNAAEYIVLSDGDPRIGLIEDESRYSPAWVDAPDCEEVIEMVNTLEDAEDIFDSNSLNLYFVAKEFTGAHFRYCTGQSSRVIFIGVTANSTTVIHEIGHALSLGHTHGLDQNHDGIDDFSSKNIMWPKMDNRDQFTAGQMVRTSLVENSLLNSGAYRVDQPKRECGREEISRACPWRALGIFTP